MRVAITQFATSKNVQENLATCLRMINEAASCKPSLIVLPELSNTPFCHAQSWYGDHNQSWNDALTIDGQFLQDIAQLAKAHDCYIVIGVTLRRDLLRNHHDGSSKSNISVTSCLFSPLGTFIHQEDKQNLTAYESKFFTSSNNDSEVITTPLGNLGLMSGDDSMNFETSRELALQGARLLCNSINLFAKDQSALHDAARASENRVFVATANKVGSLVPTENIPPEEVTILSAEYFTPQEYLVGIGQSQIVSPDGRVLAKIANKEEGFIFADINLAEAGLGFNNKLRPDGTEIVSQRRPELYEKLTASLKHAYTGTPIDSHHVPVTANVAIFATYKSNEQAIEDVCHYIENNLSDIIQLPELFFIADKTITHDAEQRTEIERLGKQLIEQVSSVLRPFQYLCTSLVIDGIHQAVLISDHGVLAIQQQLHFCQRYQWTTLGNKLNVIELTLEQGKMNVAMLTADDANIPEIVKIAALSGIHTLLVPFDIQEPCEVEYSLLSRAAENRICILAASREKSFMNESLTDNGNALNSNKLKTRKSTGLIANLTTDFALLPKWKSRKFNGYINEPLVKYQYGKITKAVIHPFAACNKLMVTQRSEHNVIGRRSMKALL